MSCTERSRPRSSTAQRGDGGFTFVEVTIAAALILILAWLVASLIIDGTRAQKFAERQSRVTEITQDIVDPDSNLPVKKHVFIVFFKLD